MVYRPPLLLIIFLLV